MKVEYECDNEYLLLIIFSFFFLFFQELNKFVKIFMHNTFMLLNEVFFFLIDELMVNKIIGTEF